VRIEHGTFPHLLLIDGGAWLEDGNEGTYEDFLQDQAKVSDKEHLIKKIEAELYEMSLKELKEILEMIRDRNFIG